MENDKEVDFSRALHWVGVLVAIWLCWWLLSEGMKPPECSWLLPGRWILPAALLFLLQAIQLIAMLVGGRWAKAKATAFLLTFWLTVATTAAIKVFGPTGENCAGHASTSEQLQVLS